MNAILAQAAALAAHAKVRALDPRLAGDDGYWAAHSTFRYVKTLAFVARNRGFIRSRAESIASTVPAWMDTLPGDAGIGLVCGESATSFPARISAALAGGTREGISVPSDTGSHLWLGAWSPTGERPPDQRVWHVRYTRVESARASETASIEQARQRLGSVLQEIDGFARGDRALSEWGDTFTAASAALTSSQPVSPYHPDILPPEGYRLAARQLLAAAVTAFVFGGMGSWNDVTPASGDRATYQRLSDALYGAVIAGLAASVNGGLAGPPRA